MRPFIFACEFQNDRCIASERLSPADAVVCGPRPSVEYTSPDADHDVELLLDYGQVRAIVERSAGSERQRNPSPA